MKNIRIEVSGKRFDAQLNDSKTAEKVWRALPVEGSVKTWGEEIYFDISVKTGHEKGFSQDTVVLGDLGYWPAGACFCIFFGKTPMSEGDEIRPASSVNVVGKFQGDLEALKRIRDGEKITIERS